MSTLRNICNEELTEILRAHGRYLLTEGKEGVCADLSNTDLTNRLLDYTNLSYANLSYAVLNSAHMNNSKLVRANLNNASLINTDLSDSILREADLQYATIYNTNLDRADLRNIKNKEIFMCPLPGSFDYGCDGYIRIGNIAKNAIEWLCTNNINIFSVYTKEEKKKYVGWFYSVLERSSE